MENPYQPGSRSHQVFDVLAHADRPLRSAEVAAAVGESDVMVVHSVVKGLRAKGVHVYRYRDPESGNGSASLYSLQPMAGLTELSSAGATGSRDSGRRRAVRRHRWCRACVSRWWAHRCG